MACWLVTGATGFLGRHCLAALAAAGPPGVEVMALARGPKPGGPGEGHFIAADLAEPADVARVLAATAPAVVMHLAGQTPPASPEAFYRGNTLATLHLLDALRARTQPVRVVLVGSAAELGSLAAEDLPVAEDFPCRPVDSYGLSKWLATTAGLAARPPLEVVVARLFNPIGPGMPPGQAFGRFAALLAEPGPDPLRLTVGDLDSRRDFIDVRDVARALIALAVHGRAGRVYHVGTGESRRVGDGLEDLIALSGRAVNVEVDPRLVSGRGPTDARADVGRIVDETGWRPEVTWRRSLEDLWGAARASARRCCP
jgi:GDP-4-dehydro-6-deoxy-D-mannose reductase